MPCRPSLIFGESVSADFSINVKRREYTSKLAVPTAPHCDNDTTDSETGGDTAGGRKGPKRVTSELTGGRFWGRLEGQRSPWPPAPDCQRIIATWRGNWRLRLNRAPVNCSAHNQLIGTVRKQVLEHPDLGALPSLSDYFYTVLSPW